MMNNTTLQPDYYLQAEWEMDGAILLSWPHAGTDWAYMLDRVRDCYVNLVEAIVAYSPVVIVAPDVDEPRRLLSHLPADRVYYVTAPTNDTWARDFGPISLLDRNSGTYHVADFRFNGWGLKFAADRDNLITSQLIEQHLITAPCINCQNFVLEGGGIESNGAGSLLTTAHCQLSPNRNPYLSREEIEQYLKQRFGARQILMLNHGFLEGDDTDSHIDTLARFAGEDTIMYVECDDPTDIHYTELQLMKQELAGMLTPEGKPFNLIGLPLPDAVYDDDGQRLPATYANFLDTPRAVFLPVYGQPRKDELATQIMKIAFQKPVVCVDCSALICQHGSLHCVTMQMPREILSIL